MNEVIATRTSPYVLNICLNRPDSGNSLNSVMTQALIDLLAHAYSDQTKLVVFGGSESAFCTGCEGGAALEVQIENVLKLIARAPFFSVARLHGPASDVGADIAITCDWRLMSTESWLCFARTRQPDAALSARRLGEIIGGFRAFDFLIRRSVVGAQDALNNGLATEIVAADTIDSYIDEISRSLNDTRKESIAILREAIGVRDGAADIERVVRSSAAGQPQ